MLGPLFPASAAQAAADSRMSANMRRGGRSPSSPAQPLRSPLLGLHACTRRPLAPIKAATSGLGHPGAHQQGNRRQEQAQEQQAAQQRTSSSPPLSAAPSATTVGVLLLNLGGPDSLDDVQPFLYNLFADPEIIRLPSALQSLQPLVATVISTLRAPKSKEGYAAIGGGSPLRRITQDQAEALARALAAKGTPANVYVGMRYWNPYTEEAIAQIKADGISKLVILPLYPQFSISTSGSSFRLLEALFKEDGELQSLQHTVIPSWYNRKGYVAAQVREGAPHQ
jgi:hypothetical protein